MRKVQLSASFSRKEEEKTNKIEEQFKIGPYSTEKSREKDIANRLTKERKMRNELIEKYSAKAPVQGRPFK